jgi:hypothetical protein
VLFELIVSRDERRSMLITANQPLGAWSRRRQLSTGSCTMPRSPFGRAKCIAITTTMAPTVRRRV